MDAMESEAHSKLEETAVADTSADVTAWSPLKAEADRSDPESAHPKRNPSSSAGNGWIASRLQLPRAIPDFGGDGNSIRPQVVSSSLVKRPHATTNDDGHGDAVRERSGLRNFKRFRKGNIVPTGPNGRTPSLFPAQTVSSVPVDNSDRQTLMHSMEQQEQQERLADALFAAVEKRTRRKF